MREYSTPSSIDIPLTGSLTDDVVRNGRDHPTAVLFSRRAGDGWADVTGAQFLGEVRGVAKGLMAAGIGAGDRVALISKTRYEWTLLDYAIWFAGAVTVPVYETSSADQIAWILADSEAGGVVVETSEHLSRVEQRRADLDGLEHLWALDRDALADLTALGTQVPDEALERRRTALTPDSLATLIYTSGTTGRPKGCQLTHGNFMVEAGVAIDELPELFKTEGACTLLFLPLAHVFARVVQVGAVKARVRLGHSADVKHLLADLEEFQPTFILGVPRVFEKLFNNASQTAAANGRGAVFDRAADGAIAYSRALDAGRPGVLAKARHAVFDRLVYRRLRASLGGRCEFAVSGGAPLGERLGHFYRGIGLVVLEGYGLTETTAALTVNLPATSKVGTVGRPLPGAGVRIAEDGEVLVTGGQLFAGYWKDERATEQAMTVDGWFRTGDLGEIDEEGFLRITGRRDEILVTASGKNVAPSVLEDRVRAHPLVSQCLVVGDGRPFIAALVTLDHDALTRWDQPHGGRASPSTHPDVRAEVESAVEEANRAVSQAEAIRKFTVLPADWTAEGGQLTPSLKVRRAVVMREFRNEIESLYSR